MRRVIKNIITKFYLSYLKTAFYIRRILFGFENANHNLTYLDERAVISILRSNGATIGSGCNIGSGIVFHNCRGSYSNLYIGDDCHIGRDCFFDLTEKIVIQNNVTISFGCKLVTHMDVGKSGLSKKYPSIQKSVSIKKNCYLGSGVMVLMGVELGESCLVAAGSVVTKSFPAGSVIMGAPAVLKKQIKNK